MIEKVGIIGSGTMGSGIAQVAATAGCQVVVYDQQTAALDRAQGALKKIMARLVEKGRLDSETAQSIQDNITFTDRIEDLEKSELVIEAIIEDLQIKQTVFQDCSLP